MSQRSYHIRVTVYIDLSSLFADLFLSLYYLARLLFCWSSSNRLPHPAVPRQLSIFVAWAHRTFFLASLLPCENSSICAIPWDHVRWWWLLRYSDDPMRWDTLPECCCPACQELLVVYASEARPGFPLPSTDKLEVLIDWCCFYYFVRNSLVALLEAVCARRRTVDFLSRARYPPTSLFVFARDILTKLLEHSIEILLLMVLSSISEQVIHRDPTKGPSDSPGHHHIGPQQARKCLAEALPRWTLDLKIF